LLASKRLLATGGLTEQSLASAVVRTALEQGAEVLLTSPDCQPSASGHRARAGLVHVGIPVDSPSAGARPCCG